MPNRKTNKKEDVNPKIDNEDVYDEQSEGCDDNSFFDEKALARLLTHRSIYLFGPINKHSVLSVISQIHICETVSYDDITIYINSEGGYVSDCFALIDVMDNSKCDISTVVLGIAASAACLIASNGTKGKRFGGKYSEFMYHESYGDLVDVSQSQLPHYMRQFGKIQKTMDKIFQRNTGKSVVEIKKKFLEKKLDRYMSSCEAKGFGIIDKILCTRKKR